ncbi:CLUMA_CG013617, isoform A [Clunio marinus]|uniref:CLUMA_CG013617, isoform A n=1 Tax=Clunio marinus TaxID=568069 RepID=A0A1J1IJG8_9DIPT|nr:CLUMA_CG013617, isoform A [Clunio marinus]
MKLHIMPPLKEKGKHNVFSIGMVHITQTTFMARYKSSRDFLRLGMFIAALCKWKVLQFKSFLGKREMQTDENLKHVLMLARKSSPGHNTCPSKWLVSSWLEICFLWSIVNNNHAAQNLMNINWRSILAVYLSFYLIIMLW